MKINIRNRKQETKGGGKFEENTKRGRTAVNRIRNTGEQGKAKVRQGDTRYYWCARLRFSSP